MKRLILTLISLILLISLSGCHNKDLNITDFETDPYTDITTEYFYAHYKESTCYMDSYWRTKHHFLSGKKEEEGLYYLPLENNYKSSGSSDYMVSDFNYTYLSDGSYESYLINDLNGNTHVIYYGGAYISLNEVAAYLLAFGEVPPNSNFLSTKGGDAVALWGEFGRVNNQEYSNNVIKYPYEPLMPEYTDLHDKLRYTETDFGTSGNYLVNNKMQTRYNNAKYITRGCARFVFVNNQENPLDRHVFYTYNHYNDFQEYLNYYDGFGKRFGNETSGGEYNKGTSPTPYVKATFISLNSLKEMFA